MSVIFVIVGAMSFGLGYAVLKLGDMVSGVSLFLISTILLIGAVIADGVNRICQLLSKKS